MIEPVYRIVLTENCNLACPHCFNAEARDCGIMDADLLIRFMRENSSNLNLSTIKIMGGEPTLHPRIKDITKEACKHYYRVELFTNGTNMKDIVMDPSITRSHFHSLLLYTINGFTFDFNKFNTYKDYINFVVLHFVVPLNNPEKMVKKAEKCMELGAQSYFLISPDTQVNIFDDSILNSYRPVWVKVVTNLVSQLRERNIPFNFDHKLPICFYTQEMIDLFHLHDIDTIHQDTTTCCGDQRIGLIDHNFDLYYCNQTRIKLGSLLDDSGNPISESELRKMIQRGPMTKVEQIKGLRDKCMRCPALASCKLGCYYNTLIEEQKNE